MTAYFNTPESPDDPTQPTAKAYLKVDLTPVGNITSAGEFPAGHVGSLTAFGSNLLISATPALTLSAGHKYVTPTQTLFVILIQLVSMTIRTKNAVPTIWRGKNPSK